MSTRDYLGLCVAIGCLFAMLLFTILFCINEIKEINDEFENERKNEK